MSTVTSDIRKLDLVIPRRRKTRVVPVGHVHVGGTNPLRIQSMTTTLTKNTEATVAQTLRLVDAGCEIVRITAPTVLDAANLENIKSALINKGCNVPLVADIHFRPDAAWKAADFVEKVRINPGNFVDGKVFKTRDYTDDEYEAELHRIEDKFTPLVLKLKKLNRALRIGTNHGSLSDRIMNRFGDTPLGMVESALEFVRICRKNEFHDIILSMKASNPKVMITAYRLLAQRMALEGMDYPFHLGVTEAGDGEDGRIKSAVGIGSLLEDGIGDTIRVSLTEDPEFEIPVAKNLASFYPHFSNGPLEENSARFGRLPIQLEKRHSQKIKTGPIELGGDAPVRILSRIEIEKQSGKDVLDLLELRVKKEAPIEILEWQQGPDSKLNSFADFLTFMRKETSRVAFWVCPRAEALRDILALGVDGIIWDASIHSSQLLTSFAEAAKNEKKTLVVRPRQKQDLENCESLSDKANVVFVIPVFAPGIQSARDMTASIPSAMKSVPVIFEYQKGAADLGGAAVMGGLICDGQGDGIAVSTQIVSSSSLDFGYNLLQACGSRITKTEYVSCPSCGRTLFDLQSTTERIKSKTGHLKGVKIAIMGCIVNGPGEMADADFGYVGGGPGKINLYVGKTCVQKSIPTADADEKLIDLIRSHGKWVDPPKEN